MGGSAMNENDLTLFGNFNVDKQLILIIYFYNDVNPPS